MDIPINEPSDEFLEDIITGNNAALLPLVC